MFTSRAEHRLLLRIDNADLRLTPIGREIGLVSDDRWERFEARRHRYEPNLEALDSAVVRRSTGSVTAARILRQPAVRLETLLASGEISLELSDSERVLDVASVETEVKYNGYLRQERSRIERARPSATEAHSGGFSILIVPGLSREVVQRLSQVRPETLGQASRIPGVTPAAVAVLGSSSGESRLKPQGSSDESGIPGSLAASRKDGRRLDFPGLASGLETYFSSSRRGTRRSTSPVSTWPTQRQKRSIGC